MKILFLIATLILCEVSSAKSNTKEWWIMKQTEGCLRAQGFMEPENVLKQYPGCRKDTNFPKGIMVLECRNTALGTSLAFMDTKEKCKKMIENLKAQGF